MTGKCEECDFVGGRHFKRCSYHKDVETERPNQETPSPEIGDNTDEQKIAGVRQIAELLKAVASRMKKYSRRVDSRSAEAHLSVFSASVCRLAEELERKANEGQDDRS